MVPFAAIQAVPIAVIAWYRLQRYVWYRYSAIVNYILAEIMEDRVKAKAWFRRELPSWGIIASKVLTPLFNEYKEDRIEFISEFEKMIKLYQV